jgi:hypothetical protein
MFGRTKSTVIENIIINPMNGYHERKELKRQREIARQFAYQLSYTMHDFKARGETLTPEKARQQQGFITLALADIYKTTPEEITRIHKTVDWVGTKR